MRSPCNGSIDLRALLGAIAAVIAIAPSLVVGQRTWGIHQREEGVELELETRIGGRPTGVAMREAMAYAAVGDRLVAYDVSDLDHIRPVAEASAPAEGLAELLLIGDALVGYRRPASNEYGAPLYSFDVSDVSKPRAADTLTISRYGRPVAITAIAAAPGLLFAAYSGAVVVVDARDPSHLSEVSTLDVVGADNDLVYNEAMTWSGGHLYLAGSRLRIVDTSDPQHLHEVGSTDLPGSATSIAVTPGAAFVGYLGGAAGVIDVSDPSAPRETGRLVAADFGLPGVSVEDLVTEGRYLFALVEGAFLWSRVPAMTHDYIVVFDVTEPLQPRRLAQIDATANVDELYISGQAAFLTLEEAPYNTGMGLATIDMWDPTAPRLRGRLDLLSDATRVAVSDDARHALVQSAATVWALDLDGPGGARPTWRRVGPMGSIDMVALQGDRYALLGPGGGSGGPRLVVLEMSEQLEPLEIGAIDISGAKDSRWGSLAVSGSLAFVGTLLAVPDHLAIVDLSNAAAPRQTAVLVSPGRVWSIAVSGQVAHVAVQREGDDAARFIWSLDVSDPTLPREIAFLPLGFRVEQLVASGGYLFAADPERGLHVLDVSDPGAMRVVASDQRRPFRSIAAQGRLLFASGPTIDPNGRLLPPGGVTVFDVANSADPREVGYLPLRQAGRIGLVQDRVFVAAGPLGLFMFRAVPSELMPTSTPGATATPPPSVTRDPALPPAVFLPSLCCRGGRRGGIGAVQECQQSTEPHSG